MIRVIAAGNDADGRADVGETLNIAVEVINRSGQADNVVGTLRAHAEGAALDDPYVTITTPTVDFGSIGPFATKDNGFVYNAQGVITGATAPFVFTVSPDCPNDHVIPFELTTTFTNGWDPTDLNVYTRISRFKIIVQRGRNVPTVIAAGTTVELGANDYWIVGGPVLIEAGATLIIDPGAQVQWGAISSDPYNPGPQTGYMVVRGTLSVQGTAASPVSLFPSYLVSGQTTRISVETAGRAYLNYAKVRNPDLSNLWTIDHCYFDRDAFASAISAQIISNSTFHKLQGAAPSSTINASRFVTDLFDETQMAPQSGAQLLNCTFLQENESGVPLSLTAPLSFRIPLATEGIPLFGGIQTHNGSTYVMLPMDYTSLRLAETVANYYGGHVTSIADATEAAFVNSFITASGGPGWTNSFILGLTDEGTPGTYRWLDGTPLDYQPWQTGYPVSLPPGTFHNVYSNWTNGNQADSTRYGSGALQNWNNFILRLPGVWSREQLMVAANDGSLNAFVRNNYPEGVRCNAFLNKYWDPNVNHWMRIRSSANVSNGYSSLLSNFWGTTTTSLIDYAIIDYYDNFTSARIDYGTPASEGYTSTYPFVQSLLINGLPADTVPTVGSGPTTFTITFNRDMDQTVEPFVTFGPSSPCTDFSVKPIGDGWIDARTWQGSFYVTPVTGEGYQLMRISGAVAADDPWLVSGYDVARYRFQVKTMGVASHEPPGCRAGRQHPPFLAAERLRPPCRLQPLPFRQSQRHVHEDQQHDHSGGA